jgi:hypothetical protein
METNGRRERLVIRQQNPDTAGELVVIEPHENSAECY